MSKLSQDVLREIERRGLVPRPVAYFLAKRAVFWVLAGLATLLGAISVALGLFVVTDALQAGGRGFDEMPFDDVAPGAPVAALAVLGLAIASAYYSVSRTRRGHRYRPGLIMTAVAAIAIALGVALHGFSAGEAVHGWLSRQFPAYRAYTTIPYAEWSRPELGQLGGAAIAVSGHELRLRDFKGREWTVDMAGAVITFAGSPVEEGDVAIRGVQTGPASFKAHSIEPFD
jgi:hypothetical protein